MSDLFEEFEFKPLTDGLGFHKKAEKIKNDAQTRMAHESFSIAQMTDDEIATTSTRREQAAPAPRPATKSLTDLLSALPKSLDFLEPQSAARNSSQTSNAPASASAAGSTQIFQPLARSEYQSQQSAAPAAPIAAPPRKTEFPAPGTKAGSLFSTVPAVPSVSVPRSARQQSLEESYSRSFPHAEKTKNLPQQEVGLHAVPAGIGSGVLDGLVVAGLSTILLVCILSITKINLVALLTNAATDSTARFNLALLFIAVLQMYMLVARAFFGATLGEWAFDLQLGRSDQQLRGAYPFRVALRTLLTTLTGLFMLPLLSAIFRRDLAARLTGVQLYRHS